MDISKLEALVLVAEEESFSAAADRAGTAQSTISSRIKELEATLDQQLFLRTARQVRLTPAGAAALPAARTALSALESIRQVVDDVAGIRRGRVRLGIVTGAEVPPLGGVLADFAQEYPGIELVVTSESSADLEQAVADGAVDIALVVRSFGPDPKETGLRWQGLLRDGLTVLGDPVSAEPGPAGTEQISISALGEERLVVLDAGAGARRTLEAAARRAGTRLAIAAQVSTPAMAEDLHLRGMGLLVIPSSFAPEDGTHLVDEGGAQMYVDVGLVTHAEIRTPATDLLLSRLLGELGEP